VHSELKIEAVSQLVLGTWPLLETLTVTFEDLTEQIVNTVVTGDWPMLKELHINVRGCNLWDRQRVDSWQAIEQGCHDVCRSRWPGLQVANFPDSKALEKRLDRQEQRMSLVNLIQKQAVDSFDSLEELRLKELELKEVELEEFKLEEFELLNNKAYNRLWT